MIRPALLFAATAIALAATACGSQCDRHPDEPPVVYTGGAVDQAGYYRTSPWSGPWLDFPPGRTYRVEHHLGGIPSEVVYYFAFNPHPVPDSGTGAGFVLGAGNQGTIQAIRSDYVDIRNDTCSEVYLLVVLGPPGVESADAGKPDASVGDASRD